MEVKVIFNTITPLFIGNAWGECEEIKPASLMGALRFWFEIYFLLELLKSPKEGKESERESEEDKENKIKLFLENYLNSEGRPCENLKYEEFKRKLKENLITFSKFEKNFVFDRVIDKTLEDLKISVPSRIFGCTGWRSRVEVRIKNYSVRDINSDNIDLSKFINSSWWIKKILFNNKERIITFENVKIILRTKEYWWDTYLKQFFEYLRNKIILVGGKNSFGFGFVNLRLYGDDVSNEISQYENEYIYQNRIKVNADVSKKVLGFNFRYYLRRKHTKPDFRYRNFGGGGDIRRASRIYISSLNPRKGNMENYLYILIFKKEPFDLENKNFLGDKIIKKYIKEIKNIF